MNKNIKRFIWISTPLIAATPALTSLASCGNDKALDALVENMQQSVVEEFNWICQFKRETYHNRWFCDVLKQHIEKLDHNYQVVSDGWNTSCDDPYIPTENGKPVDSMNYGYNMYFDIPANDKSGNLPPVILQAHTDMVIEQASSTYDWTRGVVPVITNGIMHTSGYQTTLGADDGVGVATILSIAKNPKSFKHGKIRCIFTTDEEDGDSGAKWISDNHPEWLEGYDNFINLDGEDATATSTSCGGCWEGTVSLDAIGAEQPQDYENYFKINISGLHGGHSAQVITLEIDNPIRTMAYIIKTFNEYHTGTKIQLISAYDGSDPKGKANPSSISKSITFVINTNETKENIESYLSVFKQQWLAGFDDENPDEVNFDVADEARLPVPQPISVDDTNKLVEFLSFLPFGISDDEWDLHKTCWNIGTFRFRDGNYSDVESNKIYLEVMGRSRDKETVNNFKSTYDALIKSHGYSDEWVTKASLPPWVKKLTNPLRDVVLEAGKKANKGQEFIQDDRTGWLEVAWFSHIKPDMNVVCLGPTVLEVHSVNENLNIESVTVFLKTLFYTLENYKI